MDDELLRYSCQLVLPGMGRVGQERLQRARVLLVGAGGLGCPAAQYLAAAGVGFITIADADRVAVSNLHRQVLYTPEDTGQFKAQVMCRRLGRQNPQVELHPLVTRVSRDNVMELLRGIDLVLDCSDNFPTRYLLNDACVLSGIPLVYGAIYQYEGQVGVWNLPVPGGGRSPHYRDLFPQVNEDAVPDCSTGGVLPTVAGLIGCLQAGEAVKYLAGTGELLAGRLLLADIRTMQFRVISLGARSRVPVTELPVAEEVPGIGPEELALPGSRNPFRLIDVREPEEHFRYNIGGESVPLGDLERWLEDFREDTPDILFYCATGLRSARAAARARKRYPRGRFYSLQGGLQAWLALQEHPISHSQSSPDA